MARPVDLVLNGIMRKIRPRYDSLRELYMHELRDLLSAEEQILDALPVMAKRASHPDLAETFETHRQETEEQRERLVQILSDLGDTGEQVQCEGLRGLTRESEPLLDTAGPGAVIDSALIAIAGRVEHYEIAAYNSALGLANALGLDEQAMLLQTSLEEEEAADKTLTDMAIEINQQAALR